MLTSLGEILLSLLMIILAVAKLDPFGWSMPTPVQMLFLGLLIAAYGLYTGLLYREKPKDERDVLHMHSASRFGYITGITSLVVVIVVKSLTASMDAWAVIVLAIMIIAKLIARIWERQVH